MNRRAALTALASLGSTSLAGCLDVVSGGDQSSGSGEPSAAASGSGESGASEATAAPTASPESRAGDGSTETAGVDTSLAAQGVPSTICSAPIRPYPGIVALVDPAFASDWSDHEIPDRYGTAFGSAGGIDPEHTVVGLEVDGDARAYPLEVLSEHEIVNDRFGEPVSVTYCPIWRSGLVAERVVDGETRTFAVSGQLWQPEGLYVSAAEESNTTFGAARSGGETVTVRKSGNLVMYDLATRSYWSQILARAICGPATGTTLSIRPSTVATWADWRDRHPDTSVLLPPPHSGTQPNDDYASETPPPPPNDE